MKDLRNKTTSEIWTIFNEYNDFFTKLNKETYYNMAKSNKIIKDIKNKQTNTYYDLVRLLKIQIYSMTLALEEINNKIMKFLEEENE